MHANMTNKDNKLIYPELSFTLTGVLFDVHNSLGRFSKEIQYADILEIKLKEAGMKFIREFEVEGTRNRCDFIVEDRIVVELKAKLYIVKDDYYQLQRYLQILDLKLGLLVNFRSRYLKPLRIIKTDRFVPERFIEH